MITVLTPSLSNPLRKFQRSDQVGVIRDRVQGHDNRRLLWVPGLDSLHLQDGRSWRGPELRYNPNPTIVSLGPYQPLVFRHRGFVYPVLVYKQTVFFPTPLG